MSLHLLIDNQTNRREILRRCGMGIGSLSLPGLLGQATATGPHFAPRAKRVIHIFANGGPSQVDTFDPKPELKRLDGKPLPSGNFKTERKTGVVMASPFEFKPRGRCGTEVSELFEKTAEHIDDIAVIRSMTADVPNHEPSLMLMNTGDARLVRPSMGSWLTYGLGSANENLPAFIAMCPGGYPIKETENWRSGFLPGSLQATYVDTDATDVSRLIENIRSTSVSTAQQRHQLDLLASLNKQHLQTRGGEDAVAAGALSSRIESFELAYRMQFEASEAFDVQRETAETLSMYGVDRPGRGGTHGRQMLIARRLAERGVRYIQCWHGQGQPWDHHDGLARRHRELAVESDQPIAALLSDLKRTGLLDDTLVIWGGEFGRTPVVELPKKGSNKGTMTGRDHNHYGFSMWMAGGGVRGGTVHGATDEFGFKAVENRVHVHDLHATILHLMGFDHERLTYRHAGRDFRLTDVHGRVVRELVA